jgi:hypothetical protein
MTIASRDDLIAAAKEWARINKTATATTIANQPFSMLDVAGLPGAGSLSIGAANGVVPDDTVAGYPSLQAFGGGAVGGIAVIDFSNTVTSRLTLYDRVWNSGSHALTPTGTVNLSSPPAIPVARLPGGSYRNLEIFFEINVAVAASAVTLQAIYTNDDDVASRNTVVTGSLSGFTTRRLIPAALQAGDKGLKAMTGYIVGGTAAATGSFNIVVARRLWSARVPVANSGDVHGPDKTLNVQIFDTSALWPVVTADSTSSGQPELLLGVANN